MQTPRSPREPTMIHLVLSGAIARSEVGALCDRVGEQLERSDARLVLCDVGALKDPDAATVDALARLQLTARRLGGTIQVRHASSELHGLLAFAGLCEVVGLLAALPVEPRRQTEEREEPGGIEEEGDAGDAAI